MPLFLAVFARNRIVSVAELEEGAESNKSGRIETHSDGSLTNAVIEAKTYIQAYALALNIVAEHIRRRSAGFDF